MVCGPSNKSVDVVLGVYSASFVELNMWYCCTDLLLKLADRNLRLLRIYGSSIERKDHIGPYFNKEVNSTDVCVYCVYLFTL